MSSTDQKDKLELVYTLFCDDVRLEVGNKLSLMGVFQNIIVQQVPVSLIKFAVVNHWRGEGTHLSEVRILTPDRQRAIDHAVEVMAKGLPWRGAVRSFRRKDMHER